MVRAVPRIWVRSWQVSFNRAVPTESERTRKGEESGVEARRQESHPLSLQTALTGPDMGVNCSPKVHHFSLYALERVN